MDWLGSYRGGPKRDLRDPWSSSPFTDLWDPHINFDISRSNHDITSALAHAHVDWRETHTAHIFRADLPGVSKENLKVQVEDNKILLISGQRVKEKEDQNDKWHRVERQCGSFMRRFRLPEDANSEQIGCTLKDGVLTVTVPKLETKPENKNVRQIDVV